MSLSQSSRIAIGGKTAEREEKVEREGQPIDRWGYEATNVHGEDLPVHTIPRLDRAARRRLIHRSKKSRDHHTAHRYLMIAKLGQGISRQQVARDLACAPSTVVKVARRFAEAGEEGLADQRAFNGIAKVDMRFTEQLERVLYSVPTEFGWERPTWARELLGLELVRRGFLKVGNRPSVDSLIRPAVV
jgi:transposase